LLTEANGFHFVTGLGHDNVAFGRVRWSAFGLVVAFHTNASKASVFGGHGQKLMCSL
jgi:hypothetical protein